MTKNRRVGGRPGITIDDVRQACDALERQRRVVSPANVRIEIGCGSFTTLVAHTRTLGRTPPTSPPKVSTTLTDSMERPVTGRFIFLSAPGPPASANTST